MRLVVAANLLWLRPGAVGGTEPYAIRVLGAALDSGGSELALHAFARKSVFEKHAKELERAVPRAIGALPGGMAVRLAAERTWLPRAMAQAQPDVLHHLGGTVPGKSSTPTVVTIHDLQPVEDPTNFSLTKRTWLSRAIPTAVARADVIATPSDWVGDGVADRFGLDRATVHTVSAYAETPRGGGSTGLPDVVAEGPYLLYPAMTMAHKNHLLLFRAFSVVAETRRDVQLVCVGSIGRDDKRIRASAAALSPNIHMLGHVDRPTLTALLTRAEAVVFPSRYEGFGLPILEAQLAGVPVVASTAGALPEVAGDGALFCDPDDVDAWIDVMRHPIGTNRRLEMIAAGRRNAARYNPAATAAAQMAAYRAALQ